MNISRKISIKSLNLGDVLHGQDGNIYVVCEKGNAFSLELHVDNGVSKPSYLLQLLKKFTKKYNDWKENFNKPKYEGDIYSEINAENTQIIS